MLKPTSHKQRKHDGYCYDGYKTYRRAQSGCIHWLVEREEDSVFAEMTQTASAVVCKSTRAWNYEEREGGREGGCWIALVSQSLQSHPVRIHVP